MERKKLLDHPKGELVSDMVAHILDAVDPRKAVKNQCSINDTQLTIGSSLYELPAYDKIHVIGFGKAVLAMAQGAVDVLGSRITGGYLITKHLDVKKQAELPECLVVAKGNHPVPAKDTFESSAGLLEYVKNTCENDLVIVLISGGGSALCSAPIPGVAAEDMQEMTRQLLACGAEIQEMNAIRKHIDQIKGGGLAEALQPATVVTLILSDVIGSPLDVIASGPTVPDSSGYSEVGGIFDQYGLWTNAPESIKAAINEGLSGKRKDTPKTGAECFHNVKNLLIADNILACQTGVDFAKKAGLDAYLMTTSLNGEAREVGKVLVSLIEQIRSHSAPFKPPVCLIFGGETTVTLKGKGMGGRNQELALGALQNIAGLENVLLMTLATDGEDGPTDAAGAWVTGESFDKARKSGLSVVSAMNENDSYHFFKALNQIVHTGPSGTNVNDVTLCFVF